MYLKAQRLRRYDKKQIWQPKYDFQKRCNEVLWKSRKVKDNSKWNIEDVKKFWKQVWTEEERFNEESDKAYTTNEWGQTPTRQEIHQQRRTRGNKYWNSLEQTKRLISGYMHHFLSEIREIPEKAPKWLSERCDISPTRISSNWENTYFHENQWSISLREECKRSSYGCTNQLLINKMILKHCKSKHCNMSMTWIDYRKAFDSVPHYCIIEALELLKISPVITNFLKLDNLNWKTT